MSEKSNKYLIYAEEYWDKGKTGEMFIKSFELSDSQVTEIKNLVNSLKINEIPSDNQIAKWSFGSDGIVYTIETKKGKDYSYKHYWTPSSQEKFYESETINDFISKLDAIIDFKTNDEKFGKEVPYFTWTRDGVIWNAVKLITKQNYKEYKKYRKLKKRQEKLRAKNKY